MAMLLSERAKLLESRGIDTSTFKIIMDDVCLTDKQIEREVDKPNWSVVVNTQYLKKYKDMMKMLNYGVNQYIRERLTYSYQFEFIINELEEVDRLQQEGHKDEVAEKTKFLEVFMIIDLINHSINKIDKERSSINKTEVSFYINKIRNAFTTKELLYLLKDYYSRAVFVDELAPKCSSWKDAYKGNMSYYYLKHLALNNDFTFHGMNKEETLAELCNKADEYYGKEWKLYILLEEEMGLR